MPYVTIYSSNTALINLMDGKIINHNQKYHEKNTNDCMCCTKHQHIFHVDVIVFRIFTSYNYDQYLHKIASYCMCIGIFILL